MRRKDRSFAALSAILLSITLCTAVYAGEHSSVVNESPIVLRTQGSFTVGGATLTHKGTFLVIIFSNLKVKLLTAIMLMFFTKFLSMQRPIRLSFSTAERKQRGPGSQHLMAERASKTFFCAKATQSIS